MIDRSLLFVPGQRAALFAKALASGADRVIIDLEDAVPPALKGAARDGLVSWLGSLDSRPICVRINATDTPWYEDDLRALSGLNHVAAVMLPKADSIDGIKSTRAALGPSEIALIALIESAAGVMRLPELARAGGVTRLAFGTVDFGLDTGIEGQGAVLDPIRLQFTLASRAAGLPPPIDGVTVELQDQALIRGEVARAKSLGFGGKLCIHPSQVEPINAGFLPDPQQIAWARRVMAAWSTATGVVAVDGKLVDRPVMLQAERILANLSYVSSRGELSS